jgi:hypothetical protein
MQNQKKGQGSGSADAMSLSGVSKLRNDCEIRQAEAVAFVQRVAVATTTSYAGLERRREPRISTDDAASMQVLNPLMDGRVAIRVLDVSRNGLKLSTLAHLQRGTLVQVYIRNIVAMGEVRHCVKIGDEFHAGVRLDDVLAHHSGDEPWNRAVADQQG